MNCGEDSIYIHVCVCHKNKSQHHTNGEFNYLDQLSPISALLKRAIHLEFSMELSQAYCRLSFFRLSCESVIRFLVQYLEVLNKETKRVCKRICTIFIEFSTRSKKKNLTKYRLQKKRQFRPADRVVPFFID